jgi:hypothetical protein
MQANLNRKIKLPGTKPGIDYFKISRACSEVAVWQFYGWLEQQFQTPGKGDWYQETKKVIARKLNSEAMKFLCRVMVDQNLQDWDEFAKRPASKMFFELYGGMLISVIEYVQSERSKASYQTINGANQWVNTKEENEFVLKRLAKATVDAMISAVASQDDKKILSILMQPELEAPLREWHSYITKHSDTTKSVIHDTLDLIEDYGSLPPAAPVKHKQPIYNLNAAATVNQSAPVWNLKKSPRTINNLFHSVDDKPAPERVTSNVIASPKAAPRVAELVEKVPDEKSVTTVVPSVDKPVAPRRPATPPLVCQVAGLYGAMDDVNASNAGATLGSQTFHLLRAVKK